MAEKLRVRLSIATAGGELLVRATALNQKKQMFFQAPTDEQAINGLRAQLVEYERRKEFRAGYPKTIEVKL